MSTDSVERRLAAILAADVAGYSRLMGADEEHTMTALRSHRRDVMGPKIAEHRGRIVDMAGDSLLAEFASVVDAVRCAVEIQRALTERNAPLPEERRVVFRIGINVGDVMVQGTELYGDAVNVAARLEQLAEPGGIFVSADVRNQVRDKLSVEFDDLGPRTVKNIARPVEACRVRWEGQLLPAATARATVPAQDARPGIAVLPFQNMSGDPEQDYFSDGLTEDLITELCRFPRLRVIARNSTFRYKGQAVDVAKVGKELGVNYVLEGSVRRAGERLRVTGQLIDVAAGSHVWAERYDRNLTDVFAIQDELTRTIVPLIATSVRESDLHRIVQRPTGNMTAYDLCLLGRKYLRAFNRADHERARQAFQHAIAADPNYADAYAGLGSVYRYDFVQGLGTEEESAALEKSAAALNNAIALNPQLAEAHATLGLTRMYQLRFDEAEAALEHAQALNPNNAAIRADLAVGHVFLGRFEETVREFNEGLKQDPFPVPTSFAALGAAYTWLRQYDLALAALTRGLELAPNVPHFYWALAMLHVEQGEVASAQAWIAKARELFPERSTIQAVKRLVPLKLAADWERYSSALREAGMPDG